ncbi:MAG: alpha/beta hydrolase family protein [Acidobacteria bacterium]|nr:alpha/beta hydrolase family protein [Acidobacteriota bacterium]
MIAPLFNIWERRLASVDTNRIIRPFEWGLDWLDLPDDGDPLTTLKTWARETVAHSDGFFAGGSVDAYELSDNVLRFPSALTTPWEVNNTVVGRIFHPEKPRPGAPRRAVVVLPQWNADAQGHVGLCQLFARFGITAVRLSLPYHDQRRPAELNRAEFIVSSNIGRTLHANRQAVLDARGIVDWLSHQGFERIGIMGTSLGSCLAMLTMSHEPRIVAGAFNHVSPYFADVVWRGLSTRHVRAGLEGQIDIDDLRNIWMPISPWPFIPRVRDRKVLLVYARYDQTFPVDLSRHFISEFRRQGITHDLATLPCGHYTTGKAPFKFLDGYHLTRFFVKKL